MPSKPVKKAKETVSFDEKTLRVSMLTRERQKSQSTFTFFDKNACSTATFNCLWSILILNTMAQKNGKERSDFWLSSWVFSVEKLTI